MNYRFLACLCIAGLFACACDDPDPMDLDISGFCGNGMIDPGETCDYMNVGNSTCSSVLGYQASGTLLCNATCTGFDTSRCTMDQPLPLCGNGMIDPGEECDGTELYGDGGCGTDSYLESFSCNPVTCKIASRVCKPGQPTPSLGFCGDYHIDPGEACDRTNVGLATCDTLLGAGYTGSVICKMDCSGYDLSDCKSDTPVPKTCGNNILDPGEICDGNNFSKDAKLVCPPGTVSTGHPVCSASCTLDEEKSCVPTATTCGDGILDPGEECDGDEFTPISGGCFETSVESQTCSDNCKIILTCKEAVCGDGVADGDEECDGENANIRPGHELCADSQTLKSFKCDNKCKAYDIVCEGESQSCGNGVIDPGEECDGDVFSDNLCAEGEVLSDSISCNSTTCTINVSEDKTICVKAAVCGDGVCEQDENITNCPADCLCGNNKCDEGETAESCAQDCKKIDTCGNGVLDEGEKCDGELTVNGFCGNGEILDSLKCNPNTCQTYDVVCKPINCGNGTLDEGETCDSDLLSLVTLACAPDTSSENSKLVFNLGENSCSNICEATTSCLTADNSTLVVTPAAITYLTPKYSETKNIKAHGFDWTVNSDPVLEPLEGIYAWKFGSFTKTALNHDGTATLGRYVQFDPQKYDKTIVTNDNEYVAVHFTYKRQQVKSPKNMAVLLYDLDPADPENVKATFVRDIHHFSAESLGWYYSGQIVIPTARLTDLKKPVLRIVSLDEETQTGGIYLKNLELTGIKTKAVE